MEWTWVCEHLHTWLGKPLSDVTLSDIPAIVDRWLRSVTDLDHMLLEDARKEFSLQSHTGFGIDDPTAESDRDFSSVRGEFDSDPFVKMVKDHIVNKTALAHKAKQLIL